MIENEILEQIVHGSLGQLATAVAEYKESQKLLKDRFPNSELASKRMEIARDSLRLCLHTYQQNYQQLIESK